MHTLPRKSYRSDRLRETDVKAEHYGRNVQKAEQERDAWEKKYEVSCSPVPKADDDVEIIFRNSTPNTSSR